jgi:hypothetical protein
VISAVSGKQEEAQTAEHAEHDRVRDLLSLS